MIEMVDFSGILLGLLGDVVLILISVGLTFWSARAWSIERPELGARIIRLAMIVNILLILVLGGLGGGLVILRTLWTIGYF